MNYCIEAIRWFAGAVNKTAAAEIQDNLTTGHIHYEVFG